MLLLWALNYSLCYSKTVLKFGLRAHILTELFRYSLPLGKASTVRGLWSGRCGIPAGGVRNGKNVQPHRGLDKDGQPELKGQAEAWWNLAMLGELYLGQQHIALLKPSGQCLMCLPLLPLLQQLCTDLPDLILELLLGLLQTPGTTQKTRR